MVILIGLVFQFNTAFRVFVQGFFGNYVVCLLETGELPNLGSSDQSQCDYEAFNLQAGTSPNVDPGRFGGDGQNGRRGGGLGDRDGRGRGGGRGSGRDASGRDRNGRGGAANRSGRGDGGGGRGGRPNDSLSGSSRGTESLNNPQRAGGRPSRFSTGKSNNELSNLRKERIRRNVAQNKKDKQEKSKSSSDGGSVNLGTYSTTETGNKKSSGFGRNTYIQNAEVIDDEKEQRLGRDESVAVSSEDNVKQRGKKGELLAAGKRKKDSKEIEEPSLSISSFLRYLMIAGILIAVLLFLGGQFLQISKSMEK